MWASARPVTGRRRSYQNDGVPENGTHATGRCTDCHTHDKGLAASCTDCHGDTASGKYWPDQGTTPDTAGAHLSHMAFLAQKVYGQTISALLADAATDTKQRALCEYCHMAVTNDGDHR